MSISDHHAVIAYHNGKRIRGIYRQEAGTFEARKGVVRILVPEYIYSFDFKVGGNRFRSVFGKESDYGKVGSAGKWESDAIDRAVEALLRFKKNAKSGEGPTSIKEEHELSRKAAEEKRRLEQQEITVDQLSKLFLEDIAITSPGIKNNKPRTINEYRLNLERDVLSAIGERKAKSIEREDIAEIINGIVKRGALIQANRTLATCSRLFNWALSKGRVRYNPCAQMKRYEEKPRTRVLTEPERKEERDEKPQHEEIKELWQNLSKGISSNEARVLLLCILLGARPGEICAMRWEDIGQDNWWSLAETKTEVILDCYLTKTALDIIGERQKEGFVFSMQSDSCRSIPVDRLSRYVRDNEHFGLPYWQPRDLRRTFTTISTGFGFEDKILNKAQARKDGSIIRVHYDKRKYYSELKILFETVEKEILRILNT